MVRSQVVYEKADDFTLFISFPNEVLLVLAKGIELLKAVASEKALPGNLTYANLDKMKNKLNLVIAKSGSLSLNAFEWELLEGYLKLVNRRYPNQASYAGKCNFSPGEWDLLDQIFLFAIWDDAGRVTYIPEYEMFIDLNRFDNEIMNKRMEYFELLAGYGFNNTQGGWSKSVYDHILRSGYGSFGETFYWDKNIEIRGTKFNRAAIGLIINPSSDTFYALVTFNCMVECCGDPIGAYPISKDGIDQMIDDVVNLSLKLDRKIV